MEKLRLILFWQALKSFQFPLETDLSASRKSNTIQSNTMSEKKTEEEIQNNPVIERILEEVRQAEAEGEAPSTAHHVYTSGTFEQPAEETEEES